MRPIHTARVGGKVRPVLVLTRQPARANLTWVTVAPTTSTVQGIPTELPVGPSNGLDHASVVSLDNVVTLPAAALGPRIGMLHDQQETALTEAIMLAFDLEPIV